MVLLAPMLRLDATTSDTFRRNFVGVSRSLGERVVIIRYGDLMVVDQEVGDENGVQIILRQATDGIHLVHSMYDPEFNLKECKSTKSQEKVQDFLKHFWTKYAPTSDMLQETLLPKRQRKRARSGQNASVRTNIDFRYIYNASESRQCFLLPSNYGLANALLPPPLRALLDVTGARKECRDMERTTEARLMEMKQLTPSNGRMGFEDREEVVTTGALDADEGDMLEEEMAGENRNSRDRRGIFIIPGTLWCGSGNIADTYNDLGEHKSTDECCREHDHCPYTISSWESRFSIFNHRLYTLSDCDCDQRFRDCLLGVNTSVSRTVGSAYFNLLGCACFQLEEEERCVAWSWWSWDSCSRYQRIKRAIVKAIGPVLDFLS
ncbi:uncharacterized protein [Diadema setosum]|uniref:uncharacterized protein n=1 Tax=Diadema setosum TaxID=31175 RepID=UPI003B3A8E83